MIARLLPALIPLALAALFLKRAEKSDADRPPAAVAASRSAPLGLVTFYSMAFSFAADHYLYFALPALAALAVALPASWWKTRPGASRRAALAAVLAALGLLTFSNARSTTPDRGSGSTPSRARARQLDRAE